MSHDLYVYYSVFYHCDFYGLTCLGLFYILIFIYSAYTCKCVNKIIVYCFIHCKDIMGN